MPRFANILLLLVFAQFTACAYHSVKHFTYDALHSRQCIEDTGYVNCDPDHLSYQEYEKQRQEINKSKPAPESNFSNTGSDYY